MICCAHVIIIVISVFTYVNSFNCSVGKAYKTKRQNGTHFYYFFLYVVLFYIKILLALKNVELITVMNIFLTFTAFREIIPLWFCHIPFLIRNHLNNQTFFRPVLIWGSRMTFKKSKHPEKRRKILLDFKEKKAFWTQSMILTNTLKN